MASYHYLLQQAKPRYESPAKVFAKLKSKVQREAMCASEPLGNVREKHGAEFTSPRKRAEGFWSPDELKENQRLGSYRSDVQVLTLSPISTPQKNVGYSFSDIGREEELPPVSEMGHAFMSRHARSPTKRAFLESTAVSHPLSLANREETYTDPPRIRGFDGFTVSSMMQPAGEGCARGAFQEGGAPLDRLLSPAEMFSPSRNKLRKRKWEQQEFNRVSSSTKEPMDEAASQPAQVWKAAAAFSEDATHDKTGTEDVGVSGFPADRSEMDQFTHRPEFLPPRPIVDKRCCVVLEKCPPMSPAKMFAYMKQRESKRKQQEVPEVSSSTRELFDGGHHFPQSSDVPLPAPHNVAELEDTAFTSAADSAAPAGESADSRSDPSEDALDPAGPPQQPVLLEDPLVLNSPQICIPKKHQAVFRHNKWPHRAKFPNDSVIYLKNWFLRKNHKGLFVDGIHGEEDIPWNSNVIMDRVSDSVLKTVTGRVYILVGKMNFDLTSEFPSWLLKKFVNGFPPNWKKLYEKFLSESRDGGPDRASEGRAATAKAKPAPSSAKVSVRPQRQKPFKTPDSCPPAILSSTKVSRSGRVIKPPLEYWKGGRVILDAQMNVTIHECYDTSICIPEVTTTVSARKSQKPARVFLPCSEGRKQCDSASNDEAPALLRKVKAPVRQHKPAKVGHDEKPSSNPPESPAETVSSPEEWAGRATRASRRFPAVGRVVYVDAVPQKQKVPEKASTRRPKKHRRHGNRSSERRRKRTATASPESPTVTEESSPQQSSDEEFPTRRKKKGDEAHRKRGGKVPNKSTRRVSSSSQSSEESGRELRKRATKHSQSKCTKVSPPAKPPPRSAKSSRTHKSATVVPQEQEEDRWSEAELRKLQEAVSYYPKHVAGYWAKVARVVGTRSAEECHRQHTSQGTSHTPAKKAKHARKEKAEAPKDPDQPVISARAGTLKRKQQVRQFLEAMPRDNVEDVFSSAYMQNKRFEIPSMCLSEDHDFAMSDMEPLTPMSKVFPEVKTPQCLHITPGMMGSPNRNNDDKYVFQLQKRMKKNQFNVCKQPRAAKSFTPTPSVKRTMRRCGNTENDTFVVWEMFPGQEAVLSESGEEEDFYFSDND